LSINLVCPPVYITSHQPHQTSRRLRNGLTAPLHRLSHLHLHRLGHILHLWVRPFPSISFPLPTHSPLQINSIFSALSKDAKLPSLFTSFILGQLLFGWGSGAVSLYVLFSPSTALHNIGSCSSTVDDRFLKLLCSRATVFTGLAIAFFVTTWVLEICTFFMHLWRVIDLLIYGRCSGRLCLLSIHETVA